MPQRRLIGSGSRFEAEIGYSRAVVRGDWVFVAGTTGFDYAALALTGSSLRDVVRVRYILPIAANFPQCWPILPKHFGEVRPAATMHSAEFDECNELMDFIAKEIII